MSDQPRADQPGKPAPLDPSVWREPWVQLKFFTFQPQIFPRMLGRVSRGARPGDLVSVYDKAGKLCGAGLYNPDVKIPVRVVCHTADAVDESYFDAALRRAVALRRTTLALDA